MSRCAPRVLSLPSFGAHAFRGGAMRRSSGKTSAFHASRNWLVSASRRLDTPDRFLARRSWDRVGTAGTGIVERPRAFPPGSARGYCLRAQSLFAQRGKLARLSSRVGGRSAPRFSTLWRYVVSWHQDRKSVV